MIKTYSCGRGIHYVFIGGLIPTKVGTAYYTKQGFQGVYVKNLNWFGRIRYFFKKLSIQNSLYFGDTTEVTLKDIRSRV